ncbi:hypothetical protein Aduo_011867 [Ancylostoma duodenale]
MYWRDLVISRRRGGDVPAAPHHAILARRPEGKPPNQLFVSSWRFVSNAVTTTLSGFRKLAATLPSHRTRHPDIPHATPSGRASPNAVDTVIVACAGSGP